MSDSMCPLFSYKFRELNVYHEIDLDIDIVHVSIHGYSETLFTFDSSMMLRDTNGERLGKIFLRSTEQNGKKLTSWVYESDDKTVIVSPGLDFDRDPDSNIKTEKDVVLHYLEKNYDQYLELTKPKDEQKEIPYVKPLFEYTFSGMTVTHSLVVTDSGRCVEVHIETLGVRKLFAYFTGCMRMYNEKGVYFGKIDSSSAVENGKLVFLSEDKSIRVVGYPFSDPTKDELQGRDGVYGTEKLVMEHYLQDLSRFVSVLLKEPEAS